MVAAGLPVEGQGLEGHVRDVGRARRPDARPLVLPRARAELEPGEEAADGLVGARPVQRREAALRGRLRLAARAE